MKVGLKFFLLFIFLISWVISTESLKFLEEKNYNMIGVESIPINPMKLKKSADDLCKSANGTVIDSTTIFDSNHGYLEGLVSQFCFIENDQGNSGMVDLQTLTSERPSFAATYLLKGIDLDNLPSPFTIQEICQQMRGTSISYYTNGGYTNKYGVDEVCVYADGSKVSTWVLLYISEDPQYLKIRSNIQSQPLPLNLPFIGDGTAKQSDKIDKQRLKYRHLFKASKKLNNIS
jgi:hypothetical protein